jgi:phosphoserine phosphatase
MYNNFSKNFLQDVSQKLEDFKQKVDKPVAAFDADGTLWDIDVGEIVFDHQINHWDLDLPSDPWKHYLDLKAQNPRSGYLWLAQILAGKSLEEVLEKNKEAYLAWEQENNKKLPIYPQQQELISFLKENGVEVFVVTASVAWSVVYGASLYDIPQENVIGVKTKIIDGLVSTEQDGEITYREGKAKAILNRVKPEQLFLCAGNTMGDFELLKASKVISLAVASADNSEELFSTEQELKQNAINNSWYHHSFR